MGYIETLFSKFTDLINSPYFPVLIILIFVCIFICLQIYTPGLNSIKSQKVGDGQYGDARFMTEKEISKAYTPIKYEPKKWRIGQNLPDKPGIIIGERINRKDRSITANICTDDNHCMIIGGSGIGKTTRFMYPNLEYAMACGISFLVTDTKGDIARNVAGIAEKMYGYKIPVLDLRNPMYSASDNIMYLVNRYIDLYKACDDKDSAEAISYLAKAEKYAKITARTIVFSSDNETFGNNQYFYDGAEGLLTSVIMLVAEYASPNERHIISVNEVVQDLFGTNKPKDDSEYKKLLDKLPAGHKAKMFAGAALFSADATMKSILSTALSRLKSFIDTEMEQILCFDSEIDAESFVRNKTAVFLIMPEEDPTKYFLVSLLLQQLFREILSLADEMNGSLKQRVMFYLDEFGTFTKIEGIDKMFSAIRSRGVYLVPVIQGMAQLETNYGREGADNIINNCQMTMFSGFAPQSKDADELSKALGNRTVMTGSVSSNKMGGNVNKTLQMMQQPLMSADQIRRLNKGKFILMKTSMRPAQTTLHFFKKLGIEYNARTSYTAAKRTVRKVEYASKESLDKSITAEQEMRKRLKLEKESEIRYSWDRLFQEINQQKQYCWDQVFRVILSEDRMIVDDETGEVIRPAARKNTCLLPLTISIQDY